MSVAIDSTFLDIKRKHLHNGNRLNKCIFKMVAYYYCPFIVDLTEPN